MLGFAPAPTISEDHAHWAPLGPAELTGPQGRHGWLTSPEAAYLRNREVYPAESRSHVQPRVASVTRRTGSICRVEA